VYAQTYTDFEVIVVDDGNAPRAHDVLSEYLNRPNFVYLETKKDTGGSATRNVGIRHAKGEYIAFLDDDDEWLPKKLEMQVPLLKEASSKVGFVFCAINNIHRDGKVETTPVNPDTRDYSTISLIRFNGFMTSGLVVRRTVFDVVGMFDESLPSHQEADLILRIAQKYEGAGLKEAYVNMRVSSVDDHIGGNVGRRIAGRELVLAKHNDIFLRNPKLLARHYFWLALQYREDGQYEKYTQSCHTSLAYNMTPSVFRHYLKGGIVSSIMTLKSFIIQKIFHPMHFGLMLRHMYFRKYVPSHVLTKQGIKILDAGCGRGRFSEFVAQNNPTADILSIDIAHHKEWDAYPYKNISFKVQDLHTYDESGVRDFIMSVDVLEHILDNNLIVERLARGLKKGGYIYVAVPCDATSVQIFPRSWFGKFYEWEDKEHIGMQYTLNEWREIFESCGIQVELARHTFTWWGVLGWEIEFLLSELKWAPRLNIILMPIYRLLGILDIYLPLGKGSNLLIGKKVLD